jgi:integrase
VEIKLRGLKVYSARGKWFVYRRATGEALLKGFEGTKEDLAKHMETPEFLRVYNQKRTLPRKAGEHGGGTLGALLHWYTNGDIDRLDKIKETLETPGAADDGYPKWQKLAKATRQDYLDAYDWLRPEFDLALAEVDQEGLYSLQDKCANMKWPRFADQMIRALSSAISRGIKRGKGGGLKVNPCLGMEKIHEANPNANREWFADELPVALDRAKMEIKICLILARYVGVRGQTIVELNRKQFRQHPLTGQALRYRARKNNKWVNLPVLPECQAFMKELKVQRADGLIAVRDNGQPWKDEKEMQTEVSHFLRDLEREGVIGADTTLHGLRSSYAAWWKRQGATNREIADLLGDESEVMGAHYSRHVEAEANVERAFERIKDKR